MLDSLGHKVEEVYRSCIGDSEGNLNTLQMLTAIEGRLGELLESVDTIPQDRVLMAERAKERERRIRFGSGMRGAFFHRADKDFQPKLHKLNTYLGGQAGSRSAVRSVGQQNSNYYK